MMWMLSVKILFVVAYLVVMARFLWKSRAGIFDSFILLLTAFIYLLLCWLAEDRSLLYVAVLMPGIVFIVLYARYKPLRDLSNSNSSQS